MSDDFILLKALDGLLKKFLLLSFVIFKVFDFSLDIVNLVVGENHSLNNSTSWINSRATLALTSCGQSSPISWITCKNCGLLINWLGNDWALFSYGLFWLSLLCRLRSIGGFSGCSLTLYSCFDWIRVTVIKMVSLFILFHHSFLSSVQRIDFLCANWSTIFEVNCKFLLRGQFFS